MLSKHLLSFEKCVHLCDSATKDINHYHHPRKFSLGYSGQFLFPLPSSSSHYSDICHHRLVLTLLEFQVNRITQYAFVFVRLISLSIICLRYIHIVLCISISSLFMAEQYDIVQIHRWFFCLFVLTYIDGPGLFQPEVLMIQLLWIFLYKSFVNIFSFLFSKYQGVEVLGQLPQFSISLQSFLITPGFILT